MIQAVIFNLEGVLVTTDACHLEAWRQMAEEQGLPFAPAVYGRIRGMTRMEGLEFILRKAKRSYSAGEKWALVTRKNDLYLESISRLGQECLLPGARETAEKLREMGYRMAVESAGQNTVAILKQAGIRELFDTVVDGNLVERLKPDPEALLLAARKLKLTPQECFVIEDSPAGIGAARAAGMMCMGLSDAAAAPPADFAAPNLAQADLPRILKRMRFEAEKFGVPSKGATLT